MTSRIPTCGTSTGCRRASASTAPGDLTLGADFSVRWRRVQNTQFGNPYNELPEGPLGSGLVFLADDFPTIACGYQTIGS